MVDRFAKILIEEKTKELAVKIAKVWKNIW